MPKRPPKRQRDFDADALLAFCRHVSKLLPDEDGEQESDVALRAIGAIFWRWIEYYEKGHHGFFDPASFLAAARKPTHATRVYLDRRCQVIGSHPLPAAVVAVLANAILEVTAALSVDELKAIRRQVLRLT